MADTIAKVAQDGKVKCTMCEHWSFNLDEHLLSTHSMSVESYQQSYPGAPVVSSLLWDHYKSGLSKRKRVAAPALEDLSVKLGPLGFKVNAKVPEDVCLPLPDHYRTPRIGQLSRDISHAAVALRKARSMYVWGLPGTGKDAFFHAFSAMTRTPGLMFQVNPSANIESWFFTQNFKQDGGIFWEEGRLLKALRDGYQCADGTVVPYIILITDFDRANRAQAEHLRLVLDSIQGRIMGPTGDTHKVLPGTRIVATANTAGAGDTRGRMVSANPLDASLMDRWNVKIEFHSMDWEDEEVIFKAKFPFLVKNCPAVFQQVGAATKALRQDIEAENLHWEFSHRAVQNWLQHSEDLLEARGKMDKNILKTAARVILDGAPDPETREAAQKLMDPYIPGGLLGDETFNWA